MEVEISMTIIIDVEEDDIEEVKDKVKNFEYENKMRQTEEYYIESVEKI